MVTPSEGVEITGLPLMYPYLDEPSFAEDIRVIDVENHYYSEKHTGAIDSDVPINIVNFPIVIDLADSQDLIATGGNRVVYRFTRSGGTSEDERPHVVVPEDPGEGGLH